MQDADGKSTRDFGRVLLAMVVIAVGVLYLLEGADVLDAGSTMRSERSLHVDGLAVLGGVEIKHEPPSSA
jgi:hypothetical protein